MRLKRLSVSELMAKPALSIRELAFVLDLSMPFIYRMFQNGVGPDTFYIGRVRYVRTATLLAWLAERERLARAKS